MFAEGYRRAHALSVRASRPPGEPMIVVTVLKWDCIVVLSHRPPRCNQHVISATAGRTSR